MVNKMFGDIMTITTTKSKMETIDIIMLELVPKIVDQSTAKLKDVKQYWAFAEEESQQFFERVSAEYKVGLKKKKFVKKKAVLYDCTKSPLALMLGFRPRYNSILFDDRHSSYGASDCVAVPVFDLGFKAITPQAATDVLLAALQQFFLYQSDLDAETLRIRVIRNEETSFGPKSLEPYLPAGTILHARTDFGGGGGRAAYTI